MLGGADDDDQFSPAAGSKLATLFDNAGEASNESLTYTPPRQPKSATIVDTPKSKPQTSVLCAKTVVLFKSVDGKYNNCLGKHGLALIGNDDLKMYDLIAYKDKKNILTRIKIQPTFAYNVFPDNFASFVDDVLQNWSVLFDNTEACREFFSELEKRNVKVVDNCKQTSDVEETKAETTPAEDDKETKAETSGDEETTSAEHEIKADVLSRMAKMGQAVMPVASKLSRLKQQPETDAPLVPVINQQRETNAPLVSMTNQQPETNAPQVSMTNQQPETNAPQVSMTNQQQLHYPPGTDPFSVLWMENQTHNYQMRRNLNQIAIKMDTVLQMIEENDREGIERSMLQMRVSQLHSSTVNLRTELDEALKENARLQHKLFERKSYGGVSGHDLLIRLQNEKIEHLEKQLQAKQDNEQIKQCKTFADQLALCSDLVGLNDVCKKYEGDSVVVASICKVLSTILTQYNEKADNFVDKLKATMDDFQQYILKSYDAENKTFPPDFISKLLPKNTKTATAYLIQEFEKDFKISDNDTLNFSESNY